MREQILAQGAEAIITLNNNIITKNRIPKGYRLQEIDEKIRKKRTEKEAKILNRAIKTVFVPIVLKQGEYYLNLEYIDGDKLSERLSFYEEKKQLKIMKTLGAEVSKLHDADIIHGDLTTSNIIFKKNRVYIIDFGLGFISKRIEDRAVDLYLIKRALEAKHFENSEKLFENFLKGYSKSLESNRVFEQLKKVELRGRYKH